MNEKHRYATPAVYAWQSYEPLTPACDWKSEYHDMEDGNT